MGDLVTTEGADVQLTYRGGRRLGRPSAYTLDIAEAICDAVRKGGTLHAAANAQGITRETLRAWTHEHDDFSAMLLRAEGEAELAFTQTMYDTAVEGKAGDGWRPAVEVLKRRFRANGWGDVIDIRKVDTTQLAELLRNASQGQTDAITEDGTPALLPGDDAI